MPAIAVVLLALAGAAAVFRLRPLAALTVLGLAAVLVPAPLTVPHLHTSYATVQHVLVFAGAARLAFVREDRVAARAALRPTPVLVALTLLLAYSAVVGIGFSPDAGILGYSSFRLLDLVDQLAFLVVCLALARRVGDVRQVLGVAAAAVLVSTLIAVAEHATGGSYGHWLFSRLPGQAGTDAAFPLTPRQGSPRVRAGAEFALQFGWMSAMLLPALIVVALRASRARVVWAAAGTALVVLGIYWSFTRSALGAVVIVVLVLGVLARDRRLGTLTAGICAAAIVTYLVVPSVGGHLSTSADAGSIDVRSQRLAPIMHAVAAHPFRGLGLGDVVSAGFHTTDNALLLEYAELGAVGATLLFVLFAAAVVQTGRALALPDPRDRLVAAACTTGVLTFGAGAMTYDAFTLLQDVHLLWLLVAVATVLAERRGRQVRLPRPALPVVVATGAVAVVAGVVVAAVVPMHAAQDYEFTTLTATHETLGYDAVTPAEALIDTVCGQVTALRTLGPHVSVDCVNSFGAAGVGHVRIQAPSRAALADAQEALVRAVDGPGRLPTFRLLAVDPVATGRPTVAVT
ncbi:MAG: O-antigen ligase family protein, partial [Mycobacteriales bacterium]